MDSTNEVEGTGLPPAQEGASSSGQPPVVEPVQPPEPTPEYLTKTEALEQDRRMAELVSQVRGLQSVVDKSAAEQKRVQQTVGSVDAILAAQVADGTLDETEVSRYRQQARVEALYASEPEDTEPVGGEAGSPAPAQDPRDEDAQRAYAASGLQPNDPESQALTAAGAADFPDWIRKLDAAATTKAARVTREQAAVQANEAPGAQQTTTQPPPVAGAQAPPQAGPVPGVTAVDTGTGGATETTNLGTLRSQFQAAIDSNNQEEMARLSPLIDKVTRGG